MAASNNGTLVGLDIGGHPWIRVDPDAAARVFAELRKTVERGAAPFDAKNSTFRNGRLVPQDAVDERTERTAIKAVARRRAAEVKAKS